MNSIKQGKVKKITFYILMIFSLLIFFEVSIKIFGKVLNYSQSTNLVQAEKKESLKILVLGESTSVDYLGSTSWPSELQKSLNQKKINALVTNVSIAGTNSYSILKNLPKYIEKYRPNIVISMIGINDKASFHFSKKNGSSLEAFFNNLSLVRISKSLLDLIHPYRDKYSVKFSLPPKHFLCSNHNYSKNELGWSLEKILETFTRQNVHKEILRLRERIKDPKKRASFLVYSALEISRYKLKTSEEGSLRAIALLEESFKYSFNTINATQIYLYHLVRTNQFDKCFNFIGEFDRRSTFITDMGMNKFHECYLKSHASGKKEKWRKFLKKYDYNFNDVEESKKFSSNNYKKISLILKNHGISHVAVQYPLQSVNSLKEVFKDFEAKPVMYVENVDNFKKQIKDNSNKSVFIDMFAISFGHLTCLGHKLIAKNVTEAIVTLLKRSRANEILD